MTSGELARGSMDRSGTCGRSPDGGLSAADALTGGSSQRVARYRYDVLRESWWWSQDMYELHGFAPGEVVPTTELMIAHRDEGDGADAMERARVVLTSGEAFCWRHRITDASGRTRTVLSLGEGVCDARGAVTAVEGYYVDVTDVLRREIDSESHDAVARAAVSRAVIEQAKGILIVAYGLDAHAAFELLRWHSQHRNVKLRALAAGLVELFTGDPPDAASLRQRVTAYLDPRSDGEAQALP
jgi:hypothetical protein